MNLRKAIVQVQQIGLEHGFTIVIVGGALVRLIGKKTTITKIDADKKNIFLEGAENPTTKREDAKTTVDIDCIAFSNNHDPFEKEVRKDFENLQKDLKKLQQSDFPAISLEPVLYHPYFPKPNNLLQFVSSVESYHDHDYFFRLGSIKQDVKKSSLSFWTYTFDNSDQQITSLSPLAIQLRYKIRGFSIKPKDKEKIFGNKSAFAQFTAGFNTKTKDAYKNDYAEWDKFAESVSNAKQPSLRLKKALWDAYWNTIGTYLAHGTGFVGKLLLPLGNTFFAGK